MGASPVEPRRASRSPASRCGRTAARTTPDIVRTRRRRTCSRRWQTATASADGFYIDRFDPALKPTDADADGKLDLSPTGRETGGTAAGRLDEGMDEGRERAERMPLPWRRRQRSETYDADPPRAMEPQHVRARFRNTQIAFVLANIDRAPPTNTTLHFDVHGGFRQQSVVSLTTVEVSAPARLCSGPIDSHPGSTWSTKAAPYFFVVDQRRLGQGQGGGPTRGQIVRVNPFGQPTAIGGSCRSTRTTWPPAACSRSSDGPPGPALAR